MLNFADFWSAIFGDKNRKNSEKDAFWISFPATLDDLVTPRDAGGGEGGGKLPISADFRLDFRLLLFENARTPAGVGGFLGPDKSQGGSKIKCLSINPGNM